MQSIRPTSSTEPGRHRFPRMERNNEWNATISAGLFKGGSKRL
jgi:hypothetical protein